MSALNCAARVAAMALLLGVGTAAKSAAPTAADLARCSAITAPDARLGCYDALAGRPPDHNAPSLGAAPPGSTATAPAMGSAAATAAATATAKPAPALAPDDPKNFGLTPAQLHAAPSGPAAIKARVSQIIGNPLGQGRLSVVLDNGQTWQITDEDGQVSKGDAVTIKRASLGSFLMVTPSNRLLRVRRTL